MRIVRNHHAAFRASADEMNRLKTAAAVAGLSVTEYMRRAVESAVSQTIDCNSGAMNAPDRRRAA